MNHKQGENVSPSRFSLRHVSTQHGVSVDAGCQRCQHCWVRQRLQQAANADPSLVSQGDPENQPENKGEYLCF